MPTPESEQLGKLAPEVGLIVEPPSRLAAFLASAKKFSDLGIAIPALLYACGFVVLGCYAEENGLGLQVFPAIQFFSAGAGFVIIFSCVVLVVIALRLGLNKCFRWLNSGATLANGIKKGIPWLLAASFVVNYIASKLHWEKVQMGAIYATLLSIFFSAEEWAQKMARFYLYFIGFIGGLLVLSLYAFSLYPKIPASFGGGKPRHAHVQLDMKTVSGDLAEKLRHEGQLPASGLATFEADVYLVTDNSIVAKIPHYGPGAEKHGPRSIVLQLRRADVSAIFWDSTF